MLHENIYKRVRFFLLFSIGTKVIYYFRKVLSNLHSDKFDLCSLKYSFLVNIQCFSIPSRSASVENESSTCIWSLFPTFYFLCNNSPNLKYLSIRRVFCLSLSDFEPAHSLLFESIPESNLITGGIRRKHTAFGLHRVRKGYEHRRRGTHTYDWLFMNQFLFFSLIIIINM